MALALVIMTWPLIWIGGLVTTLDAGMAVPDWPNTNGYNMFAYPWQTWLFGPFDLLIEHGHRLLASLVGFVAIGGAFAAYRWESRRWVRWLAYGTLAAVIFQGALGGARVLLDARTLAMVHGCFGPAFFAMCVVLAATTGRFWTSAARSAALEPVLRRGRRWALITTAAAYLQVVLGAQLRHVQPTASQAWFEHIVYLHLTMAFLVLVCAVLLARSLRATRPWADGFRFPSVGLLALVCIQLLLGFGSWIAKYGFPRFAENWPGAGSYLIHAQGYFESIVVTAHAATGSLILATAVLLAVRTWRGLASLAPIEPASGRAEGAWE
jgi:cytochrome c oxidase assembly protein subunit 15